MCPRLRGGKVKHPNRASLSCYQRFCRPGCDTVGSLAATMSRLVSPHGGGGLRPLLLEGEAAAAERRRAESLPKLRVSSREKGDLVMLRIGGFTPLGGFMSHDDWRRVCDEMQTTAGFFWPIPITLSTDDASLGGEIALVDPDDGSTLAVMTVTERYRIDKAHECQSVFRTTDGAHPGVQMVMQQGAFNL